MEEIKTMADEWNQKHCVPPLPSVEVERQWRDACKFLATSKSHSENIGESDKRLQGQSGIVDTVIEIAKTQIDNLFVDQYGVPYAQVRVNDHHEVMKIEGEAFQLYIAKLYHSKKQKVPSDESIAAACRILKADVLYSPSPKQIELHLHVAWGDDSRTAIIYDLCNPKRQQIKITKDGWNIVSKTDALFMRFGQTSQIEPERSHGDDVLDKILDMFKVADPRDRILAKVAIVAFFIPDIPHAILVLKDEAGSAKSTFCTFIKRLVDPTATDLAYLEIGMTLSSN